MKRTDPTSLSPEALRAVRIALISLGFLFSLVALLWAGLFSANLHPVQSRVLMAALGILLMALGAALGKVRSIPSTAGRFLFSLMLVFLLSEAIGSAGLYLLSRFRGEAADHQGNQGIQRENYRPYVIWRASPFCSETVNIGPDGLRAVPGASDRADALKVFMFGGSTMLGWYTSDEQTIAGRMQGLLSDDAIRPVNVTNFGQLAYVNTQEMIELQLQLRAGNIPDLVIFYDGVNEVTTAVLSDTPGTHMDHDAIADMYEGGQLGRTGAVRPSILVYLADFSSVRFLSALLGMEDRLDAVLTRSEPASMCWLHGADYVAPHEFATDIMEIYQGNLRIIKALSAEYGFDYLVFWQPVIFTGSKTLSQNEMEILESENEFLASVCLECEAIAREMQAQNGTFFCITDVFDDREEDLYLDMCHVSILGDSLIAARMFAEVEASGLMP